MLMCPKDCFVKLEFVELEQLVVAAVKRSNLDHFQVDLEAS